MSFMKNLRVTVVVLLFVYAVVAGEGKKKDVGDKNVEKLKNVADDEEDNDVISGKITPFQKFQKMFAEHRAIALNAIKSLQQFGDNVQRHKLVEIMLQQLFLTLAQARVNVTEWGMLPGDPFPEDLEKQESVSKVFENTAMFGDMVLRLPDIVHPLYDKNKEWQLTLAWSTVFCNESLVFEGTSGTLLNLMAQEVNLIPKSAAYTNPFKEVDPREQKRFKEQVRKEVKQKKKKKIARGPRMSHTEL